MRTNFKNITLTRSSELAISNIIKLKNIAPNKDESKIDCHNKIDRTDEQSYEKVER
jgi:hypothetical protein